MSKVFLMFSIVTLFLTVHEAPAQVDTLWTRSFGESGWDFAESVQQTADGGYIITGVTGADVNHHSDVYLIKTDGSGYAQWIKTIGRSQTQGRDYGLSVYQAEDNGYIITGFTMLPDDNMLDLYLVKTDEAGDTVWTRSYGDSLTESGQSVQQTADGGYIVTGSTDSYGAGGSDVLLLKTDGSGNIQWAKTFGGMFDEIGYSVQQTSDEGYIVAGTTDSFGAGYIDVYLVKTDESGDTLWTRSYGGVNYDYGFSVCQSSSGGYVITGKTKSFGSGDFDVYLIKTTEEGDTLWTRTFGGPGVEAGYSVTESASGDYITTGKSSSFGGGGDDVYLIKTDDSGNTLWTWVMGETSDEAGRCVKETSDGGYIITGNIGSYVAGGWDVYLVKVSEAALVSGSDTPTGAGIPRSVSLMQNYPNPFNPVTIIQFEIPDVDSKTMTIPVELSVYDIRGRFIKRLAGGNLAPGTYHIQWNGTNERRQQVPSGVYLYSIRVEDYSSTRKMILLK